MDRKQESLCRAYQLGFVPPARGLGLNKCPSFKPQLRKQMNGSAMDLHLEQAGQSVRVLNEIHMSGACFKVQQLLCTSVHAAPAVARSDRDTLACCCLSSPVQSLQAKNT